MTRIALRSRATSGFMRRPSVLTLALAAIPAVSSAQNAPTPPVAMDLRAPRTAIVVLRGANAHSASLSRLSSLDATVTPLHITLDNSTPALSPDGTRLAFRRRALPFVRDLASGVETQLFHGRTTDLDLRFVGWSPDSARLAYSVRERSTEAGPSGPLPVPAGFYVWTGPRTAPVRFADIDPSAEIDQWNDTVSVLSQAFISQDHYELRRVPTDGSRASVLSTALLPYGYSQFNRAMTVMIYMHSEAGATYPAMRRLDGTGLHRVGPTAPFGEIQWPMLSPDLTHYAVLRSHAATFDVRVGDPHAATDPIVVYVCHAECRYAWETPDRLLVLDQGSVIRVPLQGTPVVIVRNNATALVVAGGL